MLVLQPIQLACEDLGQPKRKYSTPQQLATLLGTIYLLLTTKKMGSKDCERNNRGKGLAIKDVLPPHTVDRQSEDVRTTDSEGLSTPPSPPQKLTTRQHLDQLRVELEKRDLIINSIQLEMAEIRGKADQTGRHPTGSTVTKMKRKHCRDAPKKDT